MAYRCLAPDYGGFSQMGSPVQQVFHGLPGQIAPPQVVDVVGGWPDALDDDLLEGAFGDGARRTVKVVPLVVV